MSEMEAILAEIRSTPGCEVLSPRGLPTLRQGDRLPDDLLLFFKLCGGVRLFGDRTYPMQIVGPEGFVRSNPEIVGRECPDDITDYWHIVARGGREEAISVDCSVNRLGQCYDSFWDSHGVVGSCAIVALSFTELLRRLLRNKGDCWFWLTGRGPGYGDAYG
jgi:antitoxin YokJ